MSDQRLRSVVIDEESLAAVSRDQEQERQVAIFDLLEANSFAPEGETAGPFDLKIGLIDQRLAFDITGEAYHHTLLLSLTPLRRVIKDYFVICASYYDAIRNSTPHQIEAIDMTRRALHNEGSSLLAARLEGKVAVDLATARRLFTLICALHKRDLR